ncbi:Double zinc ribbon [Enhygromyxa salina]|uniref:Double zinc ribbon n=1 Tax=Enhygromyxa salina TaxID=215803 RepID=A0A2S9XIE0_9BACT|nr:zf-TFIIB domain-containing protein [Enhygromyxa salina]PRP92597.1 Double zinc ribbon [Enhygromyxa salina]
MRLIVACSQCNRQFDASGYEVGSRFRCYCGEVVTVSQPAAHEAAVVRCSGCGAPRSDGPNCSHCGSSFAAYERDLTSICPRCVTRVSDKARFCHSCAQPLAAEGAAGELDDRICPACGGDQRMHSRRLGADLSLLECSGCAGLWLSSETFQHVIRRAEEMVADVEPNADSERPAAAMDQPVRYRPCPECKALMNRSQYGKFSRVIIDTCKQHGVWLDEGELSNILEWVRGGGLDQSRKAVHEARVQELRTQQLGVSLARNNEWRESGSSGAGRGRRGSLLLNLLF